MTAVPEILTREIAFDTFTLTRDANGDGLTLEGYASVFNQGTEINSLAEGHFIEQFAPGAFKRTIKAQTPIMQFNHGRDSRVGEVPIGAFETIREDSTGLFVRARLHDNEQVKPVRDAIASGAISGMSIRFAPLRVREEAATEPGGLRTVTVLEARLFEAGPVTFPAYPTTSVAVRARELAADPEFRAALIEELRAYMIEPVSTIGTTTSTNGNNADVSTYVVTIPADTSDRSDDDTEPVDTPDIEEGLVDTSERADEPDTYTPAVRPRMTRDERLADIERIAGWTAAA